MEINEIAPVIDSPNARQQEPAVYELTPEKEKINTMVGGEEGDTSSDNSDIISFMDFPNCTFFRAYVRLALYKQRYRSESYVALDLRNVGFAIPWGGHITDYPSLEKLGQEYISVELQNVKLAQRIKRSYPQEDGTLYKWQYAHNSEDEVSSSSSSSLLCSDDQGKSEVSSTQNEITKEEEYLTQDQPALSVDIDLHAKDKKKATDDDLEAVMATTMRTLAKMSPTTGSLLIFSEEEYSASSSSSSSLSMWYSILKWIQFLFIVMLKVIVVFVLLTVSVKISERYEVWPRMMDMPPSFQLSNGSGGNGGNAQRCEADDVPVVCRLLQKHGF
jgi:hypothetical protein